MNTEQIALSLAEIITKLQDVIDTIECNAEPTDYTNLPTIPFKDDKEYSPSKDTIERWVGMYGAKFVYEEFWHMRNWCLDNPYRQKYAHDRLRSDGKKTKGKPNGFIGGWLSRSWQNRGNTKPIKNTKKYGRRWAK